MVLLIFATLGEPLHNNTTGNSAYAVVPVTMSFKVRGRRMTQTGATLTVAFASSAKDGA